jgi:nitric oxide reductase NorD protein
VTQDPERFIGEHEHELSGTLPAPLVEDFRKAVRDLIPVLPYEHFEAWYAAGKGLASHSLRSWEAAGEYFRVSPLVIQVLNFPAFQSWAECGRELVEQSAVISAAYFRASPGVVRYLAGWQIRDWSSLGQRLYKGTWKSISLAAQYYQASPGLLAHLALEEVRYLVDLLDRLSERSYDMAAACLDAVPATLSHLDRPDRGPFLNFASVVAESNWADTRVFFEKGPALLNSVSPADRTRFLKLTAQMARAGDRQMFPYFADSATALGRTTDEHHGSLLEMAEELSPHSPAAALEFLKSSPDVLELIRHQDLSVWHAEGRRILESSPEGGEAFFRLESGKGEDVLESLSARLDLGRVADVLRLYCKALTGTPISIQPSTTLAEKGVGWVSESLPSTEGSSIFLPATVERHQDKQANFSIYKVFATHQAAHLEFGSFEFQFHRPGRLFETSAVREAPVVAGRAAISEVDGATDDLPFGPVEEEAAALKPEEPGAARPPMTEMERFFDLFANRQLASDIFTAVEDSRVDAAVGQEYGGIRHAYRDMQSDELGLRPEIRELPLREVLVENLIRASLSGYDQLLVPRPLHGLLKRALRHLRAVQVEDATVEDSAEATLRIYDLFMRTPNLLPVDSEEMNWEQWEGQPPPGSSLPSEGQGEGDAFIQPGDLPQGQDQPYQTPQAVGFRGDFKPELVQLLARLRETGETIDGEIQGAQLSPEQLKELLEKSVEINVSGAEGDLASTVGLFLTNLMKETQGEQQSKERRPGGPETEGDSTGLDPGEGSLADEPEVAFYDEWDFRAGDYKPRWCRVLERPLEEGQPEFFENALVEHAGLVYQTRKQFELMKPEMFRKIKKLPDGEDLDLDAVIEFFIDRKLGSPASDKIYWRRNKVERDVAVAFLLDMSASTDEEIEKRRTNYRDDADFDDDPRKYLTWWIQRQAQGHTGPAVKRIIDLEKESIVLLIKALETIGDAYGIYGFSGYGRDNVEFYVIKDLEESFGDRIKKRIDKITPIRSTRMGPAIRHTLTKLEAHDARVKILFLLSDGRPQDHGYGRDRTEKEYAIHDTKTALLEAKRAGIVPFCLTVDRSGHDYLRVMCQDIGYEVVADIESLPSRLPALYRRLTE